MFLLANFQNDSIKMDTLCINNPQIRWSASIVFNYVFKDNKNMVKAFHYEQEETVD